MLELTPGKWIWALSPDPDKSGKVGIFIYGEDGQVLSPKIGDLQLMSSAPEMLEMLYKVEEELDRAISLRCYTMRIETLAGEVSTLLDRINVKRQKTKKGARR